MALESLLEAICADEAADEPRLVYADALMQSGDEAMHARGEFIIIQCKLARTDCPPGERKELEARERELLAAHKMAWLAGYRLTEEEAVNITFHRGFIDKVVMTLTRFVEIAPEFDLRNLTHLDLLYNGTSDEGAKAIAQSECLRNLTHLDLQYNSIGNEGAKAIAQSKHLRNITHLDLQDNNIGVEGATALAQSENLINLTHLDLSNNNISDEGAVVIAQSKYLRNLTHLGLSYNNISDEGAAAIAQSECLRNLTHLNLQYNSIGNEGVSLIQKRWPFVHI